MRIFAFISVLIVAACGMLIPLTEKYAVRLFVLLLLAEIGVCLYMFTGTN